jgi:hypothetical protein
MQRCAIAVRSEGIDKAAEREDGKGRVLQLLLIDFNDVSCPEVEHECELIEQKNNFR